jgi:hypothetical protein
MLEAESPQECEDYANETGYEYWGNHWDAENHCVESGCYCTELWGPGCEWQESGYEIICEDEYACNTGIPGDCIYPDDGDCIYLDNGNYVLAFDGDDEVKIIGGEFISGNEPRSISVWIDGGSGNVDSLQDRFQVNQHFQILHLSIR